MKEWTPIWKVLRGRSSVLAEGVWTLTYPPLKIVIPRVGFVFAFNTLSSAVQFQSTLVNLESVCVAGAGILAWRPYHSQRLFRVPLLRAPGLWEYFWRSEGLLADDQLMEVARGTVLCEAVVCFADELAHEIRISP